VDKIKMDVVEIGWSGVDWTSLDQNRGKRGALVNLVMILRVPVATQLAASRVVLSSTELV
jgi:hypothetical protein